MTKFDAARAEQLARELREESTRMTGFRIQRLRHTVGEAAALLDAAREEIAARDAALEACQRRIAELMEVNRG